MKITYEHYKALNKMVQNLNYLRRWSDLITQDNYNELSKQGLNSMIAVIMFASCKESGVEADITKLPRIALGRAFAKAEVYFDTPEHRINEICLLGGVGKEKFDETAMEIIAKKTNMEFAEFLREDSNSIEVKIYKAATKVATYIETLELQFEFITHPEFQRISANLWEYHDLPGFEDFINPDRPLFKLFQQFSRLKNQARWTACACSLKSSVLGHLFDTAMFAYLMALEEKPEDETYASKMFLMGLFHDIAEMWTKDIPKPIKYYIEGFKKAVDNYEEKQLEKNIYKVVPKYASDMIKSIMDEEKDEVLKAKLKAADNLSADSECWRNIQGGTRDSTFSNSIINRNTNNWTPCTTILHNRFCEIAKRHKLLAEDFDV